MSLEGRQKSPISERLENRRFSQFQSGSIEDFRVRQESADS